jgi:hypothetical protein
MFAFLLSATSHCRGRNRKERKKVREKKKEEKGDTGERARVRRRKCM